MGSNVETSYCITETVQKCGRFFPVINMANRTQGLEVRELGTLFVYTTD